MEAFLSFTIKGKEYNRKEMRSGSPLPIYQSEKGLGMRVARPTDEIQVLVRTVRFDVRFRLRHGQDGLRLTIAHAIASAFQDLTARRRPAFYSFGSLH